MMSEYPQNGGSAVAMITALMRDYRIALPLECNQVHIRNIGRMSHRSRVPTR